jgi:group I intron endonuclease
LRKNIHSNILLQRAFNIDGTDNFEFRLVEECVEEVLIQREKAWIEYYKSRDRQYGYNLCDPDRHIRPICSQETRDKISKANKNRKHTEESKRNMSLAKKGMPSGRKGCKASSETIKKLSDSHKGQRSSLGYKHTEEAKRNMSLTHIGQSLGIKVRRLQKRLS